MNWLVNTTGGLAVRIALGVAVFAVLAILDLRRHGRQARRWREYLFLVFTVAVAMAYGVTNDMITSTISWEYFYHGKGLEEVLGPDVPPAGGALWWQAAKVGMMATWTVGLLLGAAVLIANNPRKRSSPLPFATLYKLALAPLACAAVLGALLGLAGGLGGLNWLDADLRLMWQEDLWRPARFTAVWGVHLGGYLGGAIGAVAAVVYILLRRRYNPLR